MKRFIKRILNKNSKNNNLLILANDNQLHNDMLFIGATMLLPNKELD